MQKTFKKLITLITVFSLITMYGIYVPNANAAALTSLKDTLSTLTASVVANHTIVFKTPTGGAASSTIILTFAGTGSWNVDSIIAADVDVATTSDLAIYSVTAGSEVITIILNEVLTAGATTTIEIGTHAGGSNQIINPSAATDHTLSISGTIGDTGTITIPIIADDSVSISGTVSQTISFAISTTTVYFGSLGGAAKYASSTNTSGDTSVVVGHTLAASTNSGSGYTITASGTTLTSGSDTITAIGDTPAASSPGSEQFGIGVADSGGTGITVDTTYASNYGFVEGANSLAVCAGASANTTYSLTYLANISITTTEYGTYSTSITYIATGNF